MLAVQHEAGYNVEHGQSSGQGCDVVKQEFDGRRKSGREDVRNPRFGVLQNVIRYLNSENKNLLVFEIKHFLTSNHSYSIVYLQPNP